MNNTDFVKEYHLDGLREARTGESDTEAGDLEKVVNTNLSLRTRVGNLEVGKNDGLYEVRFSADSYLERDYSSFVLAPFEKHRSIKKLANMGPLRKVFKSVRNPFISLAYDFNYGGGTPTVVIKYVQSTNRMTPERYAALKSELGINPHEFLLAQFLYRLSPVLDSNPKIEVLVADRYTSKNAYPKLRDRFFDGKYRLNPGKERVKQILGKGNAWIKART